MVKDSISVNPMKVKIPIHSIIDIITNSSSEIFTISSDKTKEFVIDIVNSFCKDKNLNFRLTEHCFNEVEDWELKDSISFLEEQGYTVTKTSEPTKFSFSIDRDQIYLHLQPLKDFLIKTLNAEVDYD